jgi:F-type H+-transporting ATPase subunit a
VEGIEITPKALWHVPDGIPVIGGMPISIALITGLISSVILIVAAVILRMTVLKKMQKFPRGLQNVLELIVEGMSKFTVGKVGEQTGNALAPYMFTLAAFIGCNGLLELFGFGILRPSPSDINETVAFALITFVLIRVFAYKRKGVIGRIRYYTKPIFLVAPVKLFTDMAVPVSLSCRMFGNLLGGFVVMELLYSSVFTRWGVPVIGAAFFSLFHYGMQAFIFMTLSLAFIEEAIE